MLIHFFLWFWRLQSTINSEKIKEILHENEFKIQTSSLLAPESCPEFPCSSHSFLRFSWGIVSHEKFKREPRALICLNIPVAVKVTNFNSRRCKKCPFSNWSWEFGLHWCCNHFYLRTSGFERKLYKRDRFRDSNFLKSVKSNYYFANSCIFEFDLFRNLDFASIPVPWRENPLDLNYNELSAKKGLDEFS